MSKLRGPADIERESQRTSTSTHFVRTERTRLAAEQDYDDGEHRTNGEEFLPHACFTKGFPHSSEGYVDVASWKALVDALNKKDSKALAAVPLSHQWDHRDDDPHLSGSSTPAHYPRLVSPCSAFSVQLEGPACCSVGLNPPPSISSQETAADMVELYEMALARDVPFCEFLTHRRIARGARRIFHSSKGRAASHADVDTGSAAAVVFRGNTAGDAVGPYLSQLWLTPYSRGTVMQEQTHNLPSACTDYLMDRQEYIASQNGAPPADAPRMAKIQRYVRTPRDLAWVMHEMFPYEPYIHVVMSLKALGASLAPCNPYLSGVIPNQSNFVALGVNDLLDMIPRAARAALEAAWYHKWLVHRRLRPEAMAFMVDRAMVTSENPHRIHDDLLLSANKTLTSVHRLTEGTLLLPQAYPEGSPLCPSYPSGYACVAGACATVIKAFFDENWQFPRKMVADVDGTDLVDDRTASARRLSLRGEVDKFASNAALSRCWAGVNFRADVEAGLHLGERVALRLLKDLSQRYSEHGVIFRFHLRDGTEVTVK